MSIPERRPAAGTDAPPAADPTGQPLRFLTAYWGVWQALSGRADAALGPHGLDLKSFIALGYVQGGPTSQGDLARVLGVPRYEVTRILDRLSELGAITRVAAPGNGRTRVLSATPAGHTLWAAALPAVTAVAAPALSALGPRVDALTADLETLAALTADPGTARTPSQESP